MAEVWLGVLDVQVNSVKKIRKLKSGASRVLGTHYDPQLMDSNHDLSERGTESSMQTLAESPTQDITISDSEILHVSAVHDNNMMDNVPHGISKKLSWEPVWDAEYQRYYYCNTLTWETTWEVPEGVEDYNAYLHVESVENFANEIAISTNPLEEEVLIHEVHAYKSNSLDIPGQTSNLLSEITHTGELGSVGSFTHHSNDSDVSIASLERCLEQELEENSQGRKRESRDTGASASTGTPVSSKLSSYTEPESVDGLEGEFIEVDQSSGARTIVLEEKLLDQDDETGNSIQDVGLLKSTQGVLSVHVETTTKIRHVLTVPALSHWGIRTISIHLSILQYSFIGNEIFYMNSVL